LTDDDKMVVLLEMNSLYVNEVSTRFVLTLFQTFQCLFQVQLDEHYSMVSSNFP
jgi:hypothetical protein